MKRTGCFLVGLLIVSAAAVGAEPAGKPDKSVMVMFQDAQYQEQTAGNLDKAIELYQQVIKDAAEVERLAARATFQLGMCYLKKGDKDKAAEYFQKVVSDYPSQKELVTNAKKQFEKIKPASSQSSGDYVIHYKAVDQSQNALELLNKIHPKDVSTFRYREYQANGEQLAKICTDSEESKDKLVEAINNCTELKLVKVNLPQQSYGDYVIHYKAVDQSQNALELLNKIHPKDVRTFRYIEYQANGEQLARICTDTEESKDKLVETINSSDTLKLVKVESPQQMAEVYKQKLEQPVTVNVSKSPDGDKLTVQYAVIAIAEAVSIPYQWDKSAKLADPQRRNYIDPVHIEGKIASQALTELLGSVGLSYEVDATGLYLYNPERLKEMVEDFFSKNYRDITSRKTLEWGIPTIDNNGNLSIRYRYEATIWDKDKKINDQVFTFDEKGKFVSVKDAAATVSKPDKLRAEDTQTPEATIKSFVNAVYDGNLEVARACVSQNGHDYDEFKEMLATESNHPFQAMIKAMDVNIPVEITNKSIKDGKCKISWYFTLGRVYYFGETKVEKGTHQEFSSYLELVGDRWLIKDI